MRLSIGGLRLAIADAGSWFYCELPTGHALHVFREQTAKGAPLVDAWKQDGCNMVRLGGLHMEAEA